MERKAKEQFALLCATLDKRNWKYSKDEENLSVGFGVVGDDLRMPVRIVVKANRELIVSYTSQDWSVPKELRVPFAVGVCAINNHLVDGSFDFDLTNGAIVYRITLSYHDATLGEEAIEYLIDCAASTVDDVNHVMKDFVDGKIDFDEYFKRMSN